MALQKPTKTKRGPPKGVSNNPAGPKPGYKERTHVGTPVIEAKTKAGKSAPRKFLESVLNDPKMPMAFKTDAAKALIPYTDQKMPLAIEGTNKPLTVITAADLAKFSTTELQGIAASLAALGLTEVDAEAEE